MQSVDKTMEEVAIINAESNLGLVYLEPSQLTDEEAKQYGDDYPETARTDDFFVKGYYFRYPEKSGDRLLTQVYIDGGEHHVFGISVGDDIEEAAAVLEQRGYEKTSPNSIQQGENTRTYKKHDVTIQLKTEVDSYTVSVISIITYD